MKLYLLEHGYGDDMSIIGIYDSLDIVNDIVFKRFGNRDCYITELELNKTNI